MVARNARASLMGSVVVFCSEKSCADTFAPAAAVPLRVRSTENDNERTSALKSEFTCGSELAKRTMAGYTPGCAKIPFASRAASAGVASGRDVKDFELGSGAGTLRVSSAAERPVLLDSRMRLHHENIFDDLLDAGLFRSEVALRVAAGHAEPARQNTWTMLSPALAMNLIAVMLGRKQ